MALGTEIMVMDEVWYLVDYDQASVPGIVYMSFTETNLNKQRDSVEEGIANIDKLADWDISMLKNRVVTAGEVFEIGYTVSKNGIAQEVKHFHLHIVPKYIKEQETEAKLKANEAAKNLIVGSMQRYANDVTSEQTVSTITLPSDEMKGRLIGREGRNIRTIESVTGVDLIIDDTPEAIVISSFDPLRREIAKITIETLIRDGRIHPARIEEVYEKVSNDMNEKITEMGNEACYELGVTKLDPKLVNLIGKLNFRTSYGQNVLQHAKEVAHLTGLMAAELGENVNLAKRAGLLHDIGKAIDFEVEGSHVELGEELAKKYKEDPVVINAIKSHHGDEPANSIIAELVQIADTLSAARPGARNDSLENYIKRLEQLEEIGNGFEGVEKTFAMQAGREVRVMVKPDEVDDTQSYKIAREMKEKIEKEMQYPGTIKITVIRETRAQEEAR